MTDEEKPKRCPDCSNLLEWSSGIIHCSYCNKTLHEIVQRSLTDEPKREEYECPECGETARTRRNETNWFCKTCLHEWSL